MPADRGNILIEVLVAFAILLAALAELTRAGLVGVRGADSAARYEEATVRAQSHLAAAGISAIPSDRQGDEGNGFHWHVQVTQRGTVTLRGARTERLDLIAVNVVVSWGRRSVELETERLVSELP
jgi:general secretion pathway protein I